MRIQKDYIAATCFFLESRLTQGNQWLAYDTRDHFTKEKNMYCFASKEAAEIFIKILQGKGTEAQKEVVLANSQIALKCYFSSMPLTDCKELAEESLSGGKAYQSFKQLMEMQS